MRFSTARWLDWVLAPPLRDPAHPENSRARLLAAITLIAAFLGSLTTLHRLTDPALAGLPHAGLWGGLGCVALTFATLRFAGWAEAAASILVVGAAVFVPLDALAWGGVAGATLAAMVVLPVLASFLVDGKRVFGTAAAVTVALVYVWTQTPVWPAPGPAETPWGRVANAIVSLCLLWGVAVLAVLNQGERHRMERKLAEREARYAAAIAADHAGVFEWNPSMGLVERSPRLVEMLGFGDPFSTLRPQAGRSVVERMAALREGERDALEASRTRVDGAVEWFRLDLLGVDTIKGPAVVGVIRDVTEARRAAQLKDEFLSVVSHELRSPLTSIYGALALLRNGAFDHENPETGAARQELLTIAHANSQRLLGLVNDLLDVQRLEIGGLRFHAEPTSLREAVDNVVRAFGGYADAHRTRIRLTPGEADARVLVDRQRFEQVLANFLSNACKWTATDTEVRVDITVWPTQARVTVTDAGPGIPDSFREHVFERFTQASAGTNRQRGGTGLGLYIARGFTESMGGEIGFTSTPGEGAAFWVEFPRMDDPPAG